jgi:hypothetical protein
MSAPWSKKSVLTAAGVVAWLALIGVGLWVFMARGFEPGPAGHPDPAWPEDSVLKRQPGEYTLVVALHPECPCSQATLEELDSIVAQTRGRMSAQVLCEQYDSLPDPVERTAIWSRAQRIPGIAIVKDHQGEEAHRFSARTSGETRLYGPDGQLVFHGGITTSRGQVGDNPGQAAILDFVLHGAQAHSRTSTPAFGCSL